MAMVAHLVDGEFRTHSVWTSLTTPEHKDLRQIAAALDCSYSEVLRRALKQFIWEYQHTGGFDD